MIEGMRRSWYLCNEANNIPSKLDSIRTMKYCLFVTVLLAFRNQQKTLQRSLQIFDGENNGDYSIEGILQHFC